MRGRWNGGYIGPQQTPTAGSVRGIFNAAEMQQLSGASLWPQPANDPYFQYVTALLQGNGGPPTSVSGTNTTNFNADASTNNFQLNLNGNVRNDEFHPFQEGYYSNYFDGTGDYLTAASNTAFSFSTGDFTIECWVNFNVTTIDKSLVSRYSASTGWNFRYDSNGICLFNGDTNLISKSFTPTVGLWYHLAVARQGTNLRLFINGVLENTVANSTALDNSNTLYIGRLTAATAWELNGYLSNVRIVKGTAVYTAAFTPSTTPLTAISGTSLLTCQSNRFIDNSTNRFALTKNGDVSVQYFQPFGQDALGTSTYTNNQPSPGTNGYYGVYFDGTGDYLDVTNNAVLNLGGSSYTIECWLYPTTTGTERRFLNKNDASTFGYLFYLNASNIVMFRTDNTNMTAGTLTAPTNTWTHVAVTNDGTTTRIFVNGTLSTSATGVTIGNENVNLRIGARLYTGSEAFTGYISNARIVKGTALYTSNFTPSTTPLTAIANTSLLTCQSSSIIDNSGNNLTITAAGNAAVTVTQPFTSTVAGSAVVGYGSAYFDGTGDYLTVASNTAFGFGTGDFTIECWVYPTVNARQDWVDITNGTQRALLYYSGSAITFYSVPPNAAAITGPAMTLNKWTHLAVSKQSGNTKLFVDGVQVGSTYTTNQDYGSTNSVTIGKDNAGSTHVTGYMSNLRIVKGTAVYTANFIPPSMPVTAVSNTQLLSLQYNGGASNSGFEDGGPFDFLITRNGNVSQGTFTPYGANWSNYFDGTGDYLSVPNINFSTNNFTIEGWFYYTGATIGSGTNTNLWGMSNGAGANPKLIAFLGTTDIYLYEVSSTIISVAHGMVPNTWYHLAFVRTGTSANQCFIYRNGVALNSTSLALGSQSSVTGVFNVGYVGESYGTPFTGYISNFRVVNGTAVYTSNFTPSTAPLTAITNTTLLTCQSNRLIDTSSNNFTISRTGDVSVQRFSPFRPTVAYNSATYGGSAYFDGTGDYLFNTTQSNAGFNMSSGSWTVEAWVYKTSSAAGTILNLTNNGTTVPGLHFWINSSNQLVQDNGAAATTAAGTVLLNTWAHVAAVCNGTNTQLYINGTPVGSVITQLPNAAQYFFVGAYAPGSTPFPGYISDVRVVKGTAIYTGAFTPPTAPLTSTANTSLLLGMANTGQYDNSMMAYWESANNTQSTRSQYKYGTGSLYFDGTADYLTTRYTQGQWFLGNTFTIEAWVYIIARATSDCPIFSQDVAVTGSFAFQALTILANGTLNFNVRPTTGGGITSVGGGTVPVGTWTHCAVSVDAGQARVFLNGTQVGSTTAVTMMAATLPVFVGVAGYGNGYNTGVANSNHLNGYIDDLRVTRGIARYTANFTPPTTQFVTT